MPMNSVNITRREQEALRSSCEAVRLNIMGRFISAALLVIAVILIAVLSPNPNLVAVGAVLGTIIGSLAIKIILHR